MKEKPENATETLYHNYLIENCDINIVAVFVSVEVSEKKLSTVKWRVGAQF